MTSRATMPRRGDNLEQALGFYETDDLLQPFAGLEIREHERPLAAHAARIAVHHFQRGADHRREIDLVDHQQIVLGDARAALAPALVPCRHDDYVERELPELRSGTRRPLLAPRSH